MHDDLYDEGFGAGMMECDWLSTVAGRFLRQHERAELAAGWKAGLSERAAYVADMAEMPVAAQWAGADEAGGDEYPW